MTPSQLVGRWRSAAVGALPGELITHWQHIEPLLDKAMPCNLRRFLPIDVLAIIIQGQAQSWLVRDDDDILAVID